MKQAEDKQVLKITDSVQWIGVLDYDIVTFDVVMETKYGTTYNSYFIDAEQKAVVETCKEKFWPQYLEKINTVTKPEEIRYIIVNHTEPDHSGNVARLLSIVPNAVVVGSGNAIRYLHDLIGHDFPHKIVKDGDTLSLGNKTLRFISAPNLHWPDTMYTWLEEDKVLFTCDSFGAHFCDSRMFDNLVGDYDDAFRYYFDVILKPYSRFLLKAIDKVKLLNIRAICTGHGPLLTENWKRYVDFSEELASEAIKYPLKKYVFIPYVSAYSNTGLIAEAIAEGVRQADPEMMVDVLDIEHTPLGELDEKISRSQALVVGCPTINQNILLPVYKLFALVNPIRDKGKVAGAFGSYGWSGEANNQLSSALKNLKLDVTEPGIFVKFTPHADDIEQAKRFGTLIAEKVNSKYKIEQEN